MDEHPVALAMMALSPKSWDTSLRYGVSPHPEQAPENSNRGRRSCEFFIVDGLISLRSRSGSFMKKSQFVASLSRRGSCGAMFNALRPAWVLSLAGQTSTHRAQPVQSSGATCTL